MSVVNFPDWDTGLFILLNGAHCDRLDPVMEIFSSIRFWIPLYLTVAVFIIRKKRVWSIATLAVLAVSFALTDQLSVHLFKNVFERLRPCHLEELQPVIHLLEGCGGKYGFISNHAANSFCFALFTSRFFKNGYYSALIFFWAVCVSYSRIYVGKHFPLDVICGAVFGVVCQQTGLLLYNGLRRVVFKTKGIKMSDALQ
ncbi:MAG: phosphatase PAP2 family protein [Prevotellaceae bacterium]|jgi:undecaprenyl-diphosphatase|nr:phosphatase PAP2 family protein [Prevotellaceae bacterium]